MKITREIKVAVLVILSIVLFYWGFNFLKGKDLFNKTTTLYVIYDSVEGLTPSSVVSIKGVPVGKVDSYSFIENKKVLVVLSIASDYPISKTSVAELRGSSPLGGKEIVIIPNDSDKNLVTNGSYLLSANTLGLTDKLAEQIGPVKDKVEVLLENANKLISNLNATLDATTQQKLKSTIASLEVTMSEFSQTSKSINGLLAENKSKLNTTLSNFEKTSGSLNAMSNSLEKADIGATVKKLEATLTSVNAMMTNLEQGKGSMGKLLSDDAMYTNLTKTSKELELLLQDLRLNPTRYVNVSVFGKKNKPYVAPSNETNLEQPKN
ncbi:MlaD family protein [Flavobacterium difficile]|uniref:MCE family protein n=1 Tax=Flavobacterium difficile TaxID=2709659 RepID=A0ABX0I624_9FLAO|nr:MlaD family protein [Flavobacterium difficile]NHM02057.1 MCE family protein [Flavobacterium difficile]